MTTNGRPKIPAIDLPPFPPEGFALVSAVPRMWVPVNGEIIEGYVCDPRDTCVGILATKVQEGATTDHGPFKVGDVVHVMHDPQTKRLGSMYIERKSGYPTTMEVAIQCDPIGYSVAVKIPEVDEEGNAKLTTIKEAMVRVMAMRQAATTSKAPPSPSDAKEVPENAGKTESPPA